ALAACRSGRARYPEDPELLYLEGIFHRERREWYPAERCFQGLVPREEIHHRDTEDTEGKSSATSVLSVVKKSSFSSADVGLNGYMAHHQLGLLYYQQGRWDEAETEWRLALVDRPGYLDALKGLGEIYLKQGQWPELQGIVEIL